MEPWNSPPGWYPDPGNANAEMYWDGASWTGHSRPAFPLTQPTFDGWPSGVPAAPQPVRRQHSTNTAWLVGLTAAAGVAAVVVALVAAALVTHGFRDERSYRAGYHAGNGGFAETTYRMGGAAEGSCEGALKLTQLFGDDPSFDKGDFIDGCLDGLGAR
jgi:hypothetical protein